MKKRHLTKLQFLITICLSATILFSPSTAKAALGIISINPNTVSNDRNNTLTITGSDFQTGALVSLDGYGNLITSYFSNTTLMADVPAGIPVGIYTVTVTNPDLTTASLQNALTVIPASITPTPTQTIQPPNGYERPVIVVYSYGMSQDTISPGDNFTMYVTLYNAGQHYATNVVATFTPGDLIPRETGGVVAIGEIAPGNRNDFAQPLTVSSEAWGSIATLNMLVTYTDQSGILYNETFSLTVPIHHSYSSGPTATPTPTSTATPSPTPALRPQLVITNYTTNVTPLQPGSEFSLNITVQNMGNTIAKRVTMIVGGGSSSASGYGGTQEAGGISGASGEFTNFAPIGSSNVQSLGDFVPGSIVNAVQPLIVNVTTNPGAYPLKISFSYVDEHNNLFTDDQVITLLVYRLPLVEISFYQDPNPVFAGQPNLLPLQVVNLGRNSVVLGNMRVEGETGQFSNNVILVGALDSGGYFTLDATYIPDQPGPINFIVSIDYTNDFNQPQIITKTLSVDVQEMMISEPGNGTDNGGGEVISQAPETFLHKIWRFILGLIGLDSGLDTNQTSGAVQPSENVPTENQPIIVPVGPPLKGP